MGNGYKAALARFERAVRAHEMRGAQHPFDRASIEREYATAKALLVQKLSYRDKPPKASDGTPDAALAIGEHAFTAGFWAGAEWGAKDLYLRGNRTDNEALRDAWSAYKPSEAVKALA